MRFPHLRLVVAFVVSAGCGDLGAIDPGPGAGADAGATLDPTGRATDGLAVLYLFDEGTGTSVRDTSGLGAPHDLEIANPLAYQWLPGGGLQLQQPTVITSPLAPTKIFSACVAANAITIEAWIEPDNTEQQGPVGIVTYSIDDVARNFTLGQDNAQYDVRLRTTGTDENGSPALKSADQTVAPLTQHVVYTRDPLESVVYINGIATGTGAVGGDYSEWQPSYRFGIANEVTGGRGWLGTLYLVAVYCRKLSATEVRSNFIAAF